MVQYISIYLHFAWNPFVIWGSFPDIYIYMFFYDLDISIYNLEIERLEPKNGGGWKMIFLFALSDFLGSSR